MLCGSAHSALDELGGLLQFNKGNIALHQEVMGFPAEDYNPACNMVMLANLTEEEKHDGDFLYDKLLIECDKAPNVRKNTCQLLLSAVFKDWHFPGSCPQLKDIVAAHIARTNPSVGLPAGALMEVKGKCLHAQSLQADATVTAEKCGRSGEDHGQIWSIDGKNRIVMTYTLKDWQHKQMPRCLDIYHSRCHNGASLILHDCHDKPWQQWGRHDNGKLESRHCRGKCLDVYSSGKAKIYDCHGEVPQQNVEWQPLQLPESEVEELYKVGAITAPCSFGGLRTQPERCMLSNQSYMNRFLLDQCADSTDIGTCESVIQDLFDDGWTYPESCEVVEDLVRLHWDQTNFKTTQALLQRSQGGEQVADASLSGALVAKGNSQGQVEKSAGGKGRAWGIFRDITAGLLGLAGVVVGVLPFVLR